MPVHYFDPNGVESLRENGYRDTAMAIAELIDNSIQANATKINIILIEKKKQRGERREKLVEDILIIDNGDGMDKNVLEVSMRFGGGTRHGAKKGLGKFGMGLPNSSASQAPRFEVYSWKERNQVFYNYFDFKEIKEKKSEYLPEVELVDLSNILKEELFPKSKTGTIIKWCNCDKLIYKRAKRLVKHLQKPLGRIFRYFIHDNNVEISLDVYEENREGVLSKNNSLSNVIILPFDPLFLMPNNQLEKPFNNQAISEKLNEFKFPDKGVPGQKELYEKLVSQVTIKSSYAKQHIQLPSSAGGIGGGAKTSYLGNTYLSVQGLSVMRAGREIKLDDFKFITDISNTTNRWWKVEIQFEPELDKFFGLDNTKQNVHSFRYIPDDDKEQDIYGDNLTYWFQCELSTVIKNEIKALKKELDNQTDGTRSDNRKKDNGKEKPSGPFNPKPIHSPIEDLPKVEEPPSDFAREEAKQWLLNRYPSYQNDEEKLDLTLDWFFSTSYKQYIVFLQLGENELYSYKLMQPKTIIEINTNHDFYIEFIKDILQSGDYSKIDPLLLLFGSMVEAEKLLPDSQRHIATFRGMFAIKLNQLILDWKDNK